MMSRSTLLLGTAFAVSFAGTVLAKLPLSLVLATVGSPFETGRVTGTVWEGEIAGAVLEGYPVGDIAVSASPAPLLFGRLEGRVSVTGGVARGESVVSLSPRQIALQATSLQVNIGALGLRDTFGTPMRGKLDLQADRLVLANDRCEAGNVSVTTDALEQSAQVYGGEGFHLTGRGVCEAGVFTLPLVGNGREGAAEVAIRVSSRGYQTEVSFLPSDPKLAQVLGAYGFDERDGRYSMIQRGQVF